MALWCRFRRLPTVLLGQAELYVSARVVVEVDHSSLGEWFTFDVTKGLVVTLWDECLMHFPRLEQVLQLMVKLFALCA